MKLLERSVFDMPEEKRQKVMQDILISQPDVTPERLQAVMEQELKKEVWMNDTYQVVKSTVEGKGPQMVWLSIKRLDKQPIHDWRDLQEIKNQLVGPECEGFELYPAESRKVDTANQYHLWVFSDPTMRIPVGFGERAVSYTSGEKFKQRGQNEE